MQIDMADVNHHEGMFWKAPHVKYQTLYRCESPLRVISKRLWRYQGEDFFMRSLSTHAVVVFYIGIIDLHPEAPVSGGRDHRA